MKKIKLLSVLLILAFSTSIFAQTKNSHCYIIKGEQRVETRLFKYIRYGYFIRAIDNPYHDGDYSLSMEDYLESDNYFHSKKSAEEALEILRQIDFCPIETTLLNKEN